MEMLEDKRNHQRSLCYLKAIKEDTGEQIGHVGDIHHEGLNLISEDEIPLQDDLTICIETLGEEIKISLIIKGVWKKMYEEPTHYKTGCQIINQSSDTVDAIQKLVESLQKGGRKPFKYTTSVRTNVGLA
jgi:hypothetical protein